MPSVTRGWRLKRAPGTCLARYLIQRYYQEVISTCAWTCTTSAALLVCESVWTPCKQPIKKVALRLRARNVNAGNKRCVRKSSETPRSARTCSRLRLITLRSARENGPVITAKRGRSLISVSLGRSDRSSLHLQTLPLGMPNLHHKNPLSFDIVTWKWNSEKSTEIRGRKRSQPDSTEPSSNGLNGDDDEPEDGLKIWGYMPGHAHYSIGNGNGKVIIVPMFEKPGLTACSHH